MSYYHIISDQHANEKDCRLKLLVVNSTSAGYGEGAIYDYLRMLLQDGDEAVVRCTDGSTPAASLLEGVDEFDMVVVSGGDGTVSSVSYALAGSGIPILPFPAGTANLLVSNLHLPYEPHALARVTRYMRTFDFDLGEIEAGGKKYGFEIMAGAGYDAAIMSGAQPAKKKLGPIAYFQAALANTRPKQSHLKVVIDGETHECKGLGVLFVNFSHIQFEIPVTHDTDARDGLFDVVILKASNAFELLPAVIGALRDRDGEYPDRSESMEVYRGREIEVFADPPLVMQFDGEVPGVSTPFKVRVLDKAARFVLSDEGIKAFGE